MPAQDSSKSHTFGSPEAVRLQPRLDQGTTVWPKDALEMQGFNSEEVPRVHAIKDLSPESTQSVPHEGTDIADSAPLLKDGQSEAESTSEDLQAFGTRRIH